MKLTAPKQREKLGEGKPETFDFLGFTHFCTRSRKWGSFVIGRKTIKKRMLKQLQAVKMELRRRMHDPIAKTGAWLNQMLKGYLNYYAVSGNSPSLWWYFNAVRCANVPSRGASAALLRRARCLGRCPFGAPSASGTIHLIARVLRELHDKAVAAQP